MSQYTAHRRASSYVNTNPFFDADEEATNISNTMSSLGLGLMDSSPPPALLFSSREPLLSDSYHGLGDMAGEDGSEETKSLCKSLLTTTTTTSLLGIGNIPQATTTHDLITLFSVYGALDSARVLVN